VIAAAAQALSASPLGVAMREVGWAYPLANVAHLVGLALLAGGIVAVDLRLLGAWPRLSIAALHRALTPLAVAGLVLMVASGLALFATEATTLIEQPVFLAKMGVVAAATAGAILFRWRYGAALRRWSRAPLFARLLAAVSLSFWLAALILGRMIAYR
jgi:hypothetical protein